MLTSPPQHPQGVETGEGGHCTLQASQMGPYSIVLQSDHLSKILSQGEYSSIEIPGDLITDWLRYKRVGSRPRRKNPGQRPLSPNNKPVRACQDKHLNFNSKRILQQKQNTWADVINRAWVLFIIVS